MITTMLDDKGAVTLMNIHAMQLNGGAPLKVNRIEREDGGFFFAICVGITQLLISPAQAHQLSIDLSETPAPAVEEVLSGREAEIARIERNREHDDDTIYCYGGCGNSWLNCACPVAP